MNLHKWVDQLAKKGGVGFFGFEVFCFAFTKHTVISYSGVCTLLAATLRSIKEKLELIQNKSELWCHASM